MKITTRSSLPALMVTLAACHAADARDPLGSSPATIGREVMRADSPRAAWLEMRGFEEEANGQWTRTSSVFDSDSAVADPAAADDAHSVLGHEWRIADGDFVAFSTCSRGTTKVALEWMNHIAPELERLFGRRPEVPATVILLRSNEQYNGFAVTQAEIGELPPDSMGWAAFHHAFPCDRWLDRSNGMDPVGAACAYWDDRTRAGNAWGPFAVRHAAAHAFIEALDPSPLALSTFTASPEGAFPSAAFWSEKRVPLWLRYGAAMYCERFALQRGDADPAAVQRWSIDELEARGGANEFDELFRFPLEPTDPAASTRLMLTAGAVVAFIADTSAAEDHPALVHMQRLLADDVPPGETAERAVALEAETRAAAADFDAFLSRQGSAADEG